MKNFVYILEQLTQTIQQDDSFDVYAFDLISLLNLTDAELTEIRAAVQEVELIHVDEFWELTEAIYKHLMLPTITPDLQKYFTELQQSSHKVVQVLYQLHPWKTFQLQATNLEKETILTSKLTLNTIYAEMQIQRFLDHLHIEDKSWKNELYDFDYAFNFESTVETLFRTLAFTSWQKAKGLTNAQTSGFIVERQGGSHTYDLDNGINIDELELSIEAYIAAYK